MGFEREGRSWHIPVSDTQAYRQFGNAVVVPVVEFLAQAMKPHIQNAVSKPSFCASDDIANHQRRELEIC
jgi:DNA (cytosine-5)-methyltransferase 1